MTPIVAYKESDRPQNKVVLANGKLQSGDKSCRQANSWFSAKRQPDSEWSRRFHRGILAFLRHVICCII